MIDKDKNGEKIEVGYTVKCDKDNDGYNFDPAEGIVIKKEINRINNRTNNKYLYKVKLYKCSNKESNWNQKEGWTYFSKHLTIISKDRSKYYLSKLKE